MPRVTCEDHQLLLEAYCVSVNCTHRISCAVCCQEKHKGCPDGSLRRLNFDPTHLKLKSHSYCKTAIKRHYRQNVRLVLSTLGNTMEKNFNQLLDQKLAKFDFKMDQLKNKVAVNSGDLLIVPSSESSEPSLVLKEQVRIDSWIQLHYLKMLFVFGTQIPQMFLFWETPSLITPEMLGRHNMEAFRRLIPPKLHVAYNLSANGHNQFKFI